MIAKIIIWIVAAFYGYGALVHILNMAGKSGFNWLEAPLKWQALDIVYLVLDLTVVFGFILGWRVGYVAFFVAVISQIVLYTVFRTWILDVPEKFYRAPEEVKYLDTLVIFHVVTIILVVLAIWLKRSSASATSI